MVAQRWITDVMGAFSKIVRKFSDKLANDFAKAQGVDAPEIELDLKNLPPKLTDLQSFRSSTFFGDLKDYFKEEAIGDVSNIKNVDVLPSKSIGEKEAVNEIDSYLYGTFQNTDWWENFEKSELENIVGELKNKHSLDNEDVIEYMTEIGGADEDVIADVQSIINPNVEALKPPSQSETGQYFGDASEGVMTFEEALNFVKGVTKDD